MRQDFCGYKAGDIFVFRNVRYQSVREIEKDKCTGCCWQHPKGCNVPIATHVFDFCKANSVIFKRLKL